MTNSFKPLFQLLGAQVLAQLALVAMGNTPYASSLAVALLCAAAPLYSRRVAGFYRKAFNRTAP